SREDTGLGRGWSDRASHDHRFVTQRFKAAQRGGATCHAPRRRASPPTGGARGDDRATSFHRLTKPPDHHPACTAEGGTGQGNPRHRLGTRLPWWDRGRPATHHGLAVTNPRITA